MSKTRLKGLSLRSMLVLTCLLGSVLSGFSQNRIHVGIGYNQSFVALDSLNYVLNAFNKENAWTANKPMHEIHAPAGITATLAAISMAFW